MVASLRDAATVEAIAPLSRFGEDGVKVGADRRDGLSATLEALELRMAPVPSRPPFESSLGKEAFPPKSHEALRIEVSRVERPEPHFWFPGPAFGGELAREGDAPRAGRESALIMT